MPFDRPTLSSLRERTRAEFSTRIPGADSLLRHSNLRVCADVFAGLSHEQFGFLDWLSQQVIPDSAESTWLERWANIFGLARKPASRAGGTVVFTGADGAAVPTGALVVRSDGQEYVVGQGGTIAAGQVTLQVEAQAAGALGDADTGQSLQIVSTFPGVDATAQVASGGLVGGADIESDDSLRVRLLLRIQAPAHGGNASDYQQWALEVPGVTRVWVAPQEAGIGTVMLRFMMDQVQAANNGFPQGNGAPTYSGDLKSVFDHVEVVRPVTAELIVAAPVAVPLDLTISALQPDTPEVRAAIEAELKDMLFRRGAPGATIHLSWIWEAISIAAGEDRHSITSPASDVTHLAGELPILGAISYV